MVRYHSDTESDSYRYDDSNSSEESNTDLEMPEFDQKSATQIAEYLDSKMNNTKKRSISVNTSVNGNQNNNNNNNQQPNTNTYQSPAAEKIWTPLSQSTPAEISSTKVQPRDIIKAKSRLSNLAVSADLSDSINDASDESDGSNEKMSQDTSFQDTPLKSSKKKSSPNVQIQSNPIQVSNPTPNYDKEIKELKELRDLKNYISKLPNGFSILDEFNSHQEEVTYGIYKVNSIDEKDVQIGNLKAQVDEFERKSKGSNEEIELYKDSNNRLKEEIDLITKSNENLKKDIDFKAKTNIDLKKDLDNSTEKLKNLKLSNEKLERELMDIQLKLKSVLGDLEEAAIESKYPSLKETESNGKTVQEYLEIDQINDLNLSKSHRLLKNILINLEIPLSQAHIMIPKIANLLQSEDILLNFANRVHLLLYNKKLNMSKFQRKKEGGQHLHQCTTSMFENIELMSRVLGDQGF
ncbi:Laminin subunit beta-4 [Wickerhamomyces ciferrii]|uniref:Laminin subunit beta-4 n=1 Tax=Wickerhamomyces ciferrii (strain ATCC 14091 / BCRC 22168 / CBS 111 / JCM 3599 / NBRC 0793 / NRRL Y-1031 F-60-10) TaxID=1206466 RepID=K0KI32_WICCF|nr:Laminin subunit beta-4 [Wickerhamomyces ciferrii]CCH41817.1 Laminin subunit beta-4 [Wickerhamomyces ciferrii]